LRRYLREQFKTIIKLDDPPHKLAFAFALGVFIAFSPWIGLHIISCFFFAWLFRVSKLVVLTASFVNNPWTMVPIFGFSLWFGVKITNTSIVAPDIAWHELSFTSAYYILKPYLWPFVAGTIVSGCIAAIISYFAIYYAAIRYKKSQVR